MSRVKKVIRHEVMCQILRTGCPVHVDEIRNTLIGLGKEKECARLSQNILAIKNDGGYVRVHKDGRNVTHYELTNPEYFNDLGRFIGKPGEKSIDNLVETEYNDSKIKSESVELE